MSVKKVSAFAFAVSVLAVTLFSCGGAKTVSGPAATGNVEVVTPRTEFTKIANDKFSDHYWGIGEGASSKESMAATIAAAKAREGIAQMMKTTIDSKAKNAGMNSIGGEARETFLERLVQNAQGTVADARQREVKTLFNQNSGQYTVYVLMSVPMSSANDALKRQIENENAINDAQASKELMDIIDSGLDGAK
jgi:hypothetical protein